VLTTVKQIGSPKTSSVNQEIATLAPLRVAPATRWSQLLTVNDGTPLLDWQAGTPIPPKHHYEKLVQLVVWFIVVIWPMAFISIDRSNSRHDV
jgi:hypothetical protein